MVPLIIGSSPGSLGIPGSPGSPGSLVPLVPLVSLVPRVPQDPWFPSFSWFPLTPPFSIIEGTLKDYVYMRSSYQIQEGGIESEREIEMGGG